MRSIPRLLRAIVIIAVVLTTPIVRAQSTATPAQRPGWVFTPSIAFGGSWDDNVLLVNAGTNPPADYGTPLTPAASLDYTGKFTRFSTGYSGSLTKYMTLHEIDSFQQSFNALIEQKTSNKVTIVGEESFNAAPTTDLLQLSGVPFYRIGSLSNAAGGGVHAALAKHVSLSSTYTLRTVTFDTTTFRINQLQGGHAHEWTTALEVTRSRRLVVGASYEFSRAIVNSQTVAGVPGPEDRFNLQTLEGTVRYQVQTGTMVSGGFGTALMGGSLTHAARRGPEWHAGISQQAGRGVVSAGYSRSYIPSFGFGGTIQNQQFDGNVHMPIGRTRAFVEGGLTWTNNEPLDTLQPNLQTTWLSSIVGYSLTRWLTVEGYYQRTKQDAQRPGGLLERNQVGFQIVAAKPVRIR